MIYRVITFEVHKLTELKTIYFVTLQIESKTELSQN